MTMKKKKPHAAREVFVLSFGPKLKKLKCKMNLTSYWAKVL